MYRFVHPLLVLALVSVAGCGAGQAYSSVSAAPVSGGYAPATSGSYEVSASVTTSSPSAPSYGGGGEVMRETAPEPDPSTRPGLATQWGEARSSRVHTTAFRRGSVDPTALATVHYNDASGAAAQAALASAVSGGAHANIGNGANQVFISLLDEHGQSLPAYHVGGRAYVLGQPGRRYSIRIDNRSAYRFEAVVSVDGLDVVDGREASLSKRGYVVGPGGSTTIEGFRTSTTQVAAFRFGAVGTSYAAQTTGSARNVGVVGVALFAEAGVVVNLYEEAVRREQADPFPGRYAAPPPSHIAH